MGVNRAKAKRLALPYWGLIVARRGMWSVGVDMTSETADDEQCREEMTHDGVNGTQCLGFKRMSSGYKTI